ncbi:MAG TPA: hypothetical protein PK668_23275 [Myxococcota bacterium]|nr:hypothetical protein [Myxococcota bacterium]HRY96529.1 hypothetical protein [Myxococcota bacterium]HSA24837.1 hypothetical protein [Myxococcota bacterium]
MVISFVCRQCEADDEVELADLLKDARKLTCSNCRAKLNADLIEAFATSLDETLAALGRLNKKFHLEFAVDSDDLLEAGEAAEEFTEAGEEDALWSDDVEPEEEEEE